MIADVKQPGRRDLELVDDHTEEPMPLPPTVFARSEDLERKAGELRMVEQTLELRRREVGVRDEGQPHPVELVSESSESRDLHVWEKDRLFDRYLDLGQFCGIEALESAVDLLVDLLERHFRDGWFASRLPSLLLRRSPEPGEVGRTQPIGQGAGRPQRLADERKRVGGLRHRPPE